jgi:hypothetical protein
MLFKYIIISKTKNLKNIPMKYTTALIAALSIVSVANAGFTWSTKGCGDPSSIAYSATMLTMRDHNLIYADSWAMKMYNLA